MKFRGLLAAAVVLLVLGGVLYWSEHRKPKETASSVTPTIVKVDPSAVTSLTVKQKNAPPVTLVRKSPSDWRITAPSDVAANSDAVSGILSGLAPLTSQRVIEEKATDLSQYGLSNPLVELDITSKNNKSSRILVGDDTPTGDAVYVAVAGDPRVFTAASWVKSSLNKSFDDLRDKRLVPVDSSAVTSIELDRKNQDITFGRVQNGWQMQKPKPYRTNTYQVDDLLQQVTSAKWDSSTTEVDAAKAFAHGTPLATVKVVSSFGTDTLEVRKDQDLDYAQSSAVKGAYKIDPTIATALNEALTRSLDDYRNKELFDFGYTDPDKVEYRSGSTSMVLTHTGNDWWSNGKKMDMESVEAVVTALRDLAASKFVDSGFSNPQIEITVMPGGGKKPEQVEMQKTSDGGALAKVGDDPSIYSLDSAAINGLTTAISGLKPAAAKKK